MSTIEALFNEYKNIATKAEILAYKDVKSDVTFALAIGLYEIWHQDLSQSDGKPQKALIQPDMIGPTFMPHMVLFDVLEAGEDFKWRLFGTRHREEYGIDLTHQHVNQLLDHSGVPELKEMLQDCYHKQEAIFYRFNYVNKGEVLRRSTGVFLPFWNDLGDQVKYIASVTDWL